MRKYLSVNAMNAGAAMALSVVASACGSQGTDRDDGASEVGEFAQPLLGTSSYTGCTSEQTALLESAMHYGRVAARSNAFVECLDETIRQGRTMNYRVLTGDDGGQPLPRGPYIACGSGPSCQTSPPAAGCQFDPIATETIDRQAARAQSSAVSRFDLDITCAIESGGAGATAKPPSQLDGEEEGWTWRFLSLSTDPFKIADLSWHEAAHVEGYHHESAAECGYATGDYFTRNSMNYMTEYCVREVLEFSADHCGPLEASTCPNNGYSLIKSIAYAVDVTQPVPDECECVPDVLDSNESSDFFGGALAVGNFNGDAYEDLAVGAPGEDSAAGAIYLFKGSPTGLTYWRSIKQNQIHIKDYARSVEGYLSPASSDQMGYALAAGDLNSDGLDDLAVGFRLKATDQQRTGYVVVLPGSSGEGARAGVDPLLAQGVSQTGVETNESDDLFGSALAIGDLDSDGRDDLVVGAPGEVYNGVRSGYAMAYKGKNTVPNSTPKGRLYVEPWAGLRQFAPWGNDANDEFGYSIAIGNRDADSNAEIAIGAPGENTQAGYVYVLGYNGSSFVIETAIGNGGVGTNVRFGASLVWGNFVGGSDADLAVGAPWQSSSSGRVHVLTSPGLTTRTILSQSPGGSNGAGDLYGTSLAAGRLDGDGYDDLAIGTPGETTGPSPGVPYAGLTFIFRGGSTAPTYVAYRRQGSVYTAPYVGRPMDEPEVDNAFEYFGLAVAVGNFNAGSGDAIVSAAPSNQVRENRTNIGAGSLWVFDNGTLTASRRIDQRTMKFGDAPIFQ